MRGLVGIMLSIMLMSATSKNQFATFIKLIKKTSMVLLIQNGDYK